MVANGLIPKPTLWTFQFFARLRGTPVLRGEDCVVLREEDGSYRGVFWNLCKETREKRTVECLLPAADGEWVMVTRVVDEEVCNPLKVWHDLGEHASLRREELALIRDAARPATARCTVQAQNESIKLNIELRENAVVWLELKKVHRDESFGYEYPAFPR